MACSRTDRSTSPEAAAVCLSGACQTLAYDATTGAWDEAPFALATAADELLGPDGHLYRVGERGLIHRGLVEDFDALLAADVAIDEGWATGAPGWRDWVLVLGTGDEAGHQRLLDVASGARFAWQGRVYTTRAVGIGGVELRETGEVLARVSETFARVVDEVVDLEVAYPDGSVATLTGTAEHPFWVEAEAAWVKLGELAEGVVLTTDDGGEAVVVGLTVRPGATEVFNIEVAGPHNYFVRADGGDGPGVLVHNKTGHYVIEFANGCVYIGKGGAKRMRKSVRDKQNKYGTTAINQHWRSSASNADAFRDEAYWMDLYGWGDPNSTQCFYNKINSPGHGKYNIWR